MNKKYRMTLWIDEKLAGKIKHKSIDVKQSVSKIVEMLISDYLNKK